MKRGCSRLLNAKTIRWLHERQSSEGVCPTGTGFRPGTETGDAGRLHAIRTCRPWGRAECVFAANCSAPQTVATSSRRGIDPKYGVAASPRVVGENDPVPKGGGREMVGKPYVVAGRTYVPRENPTGYVRVGLASWYGTAFHGRLTANGEIFDRYSIAAAHPTLPLPSYARVTNLQNKRSMIVRVNDRGPYHANRLMDVSQQVAEALDFKHVGTSRVRVEYVGRASTRGSDDNKLLATLRTDGRPAPFPGRASIMVADAGESASPPAWSPPSPRGVDASRSGEADAEPAAVPAPAMAA